MNKNRYMMLLFAAITAITAGAGSAVAAGVQVAATTSFSENGAIREAVKNECELQTKLPGFVKEFADSYGIDVALTENNPNKNKGKVLVLEITGVSGGSGGAWSGAKSVQVKGELFESGKSVGNFIASRYSGGGMFAAYKGTCSIMGRCVKTIGKDIATWLKKPTKNAHLGDS